MPIEKRTLKLAITSKEEISELLKFLQELEFLYKYQLRGTYLENCDLSEFDIIKNFTKESPENFLEEVCDKLSEISFWTILINADTLLSNCADLTKDTLEFHPDIARGLELLALQKKGKIFLKSE